MNNILDDFEFPDVARENFINKGLTQQLISQGSGVSISTFTMAGHEKGVPFRFVCIAEKNNIKSQDFDMEINDNVDLVEWFVTKDHKPTERVTLLGDDFLKFRKEKVIMSDGTSRMFIKKEIDDQGNVKMECVGGKWKDAYIAWKNGLSSGGLSLERWGKVTPGHVATLNALGVFSVEQFAAMPRDRVEGRMPLDLVKIFEDAIHYVNSQQPMQEIKHYADQMLELKQELAKRARENEALRQRMDEIMETREAAPAKKRGRPRKTQVEVSPEEGAEHVD